MKSVIVTSAGGPVAENVILSLKLAGDIYVVGTDVNWNMLQLSSADFKAAVHHSSEATDMYVEDLSWLAKNCRATMLMPISDREIYIAAVNKRRLPKMSIPHFAVVTQCRDKAALYTFMKEHGFPVPQGFQLVKEPIDIEKPMWMRATIGAGGWLAHKVESKKDIATILHLHRNRKRSFMICNYLPGRNYCWTSLWVDGKLRCSVTKQRLRWVYRRIGTTAVQRTVHNPAVSKLCEDVVRCLVDSYDNNMTALMMVDLKENGEVYITEINAGRTGTVSLFFTLASELAYHNHRVNFPYQLFRAHHGLKLLPCKKHDALPENMMYIRHIDMGSLLTWEDKEVRCPLVY